MAQKTDKKPKDKISSGLPFESEQFNATQWVEAFEAAKSQGKSGLSSLRREVMKGTWHACKEGSYTTADGEKVKLDQKKVLENCANGIMYDNSYHYTHNTPLNKHSTIITVSNADCLDIAEELKASGLNPLVLNMANLNTPGGGYRAGSGAQEENLFRRTNYYQHLEDPDDVIKSRTWKYPLPEFGGVYSPEVIVMRRNEKCGYAFISPFTVSMVACAAYSKPKVKMIKQPDGNDVIMLCENMERGTVQKMRAILHIGLENGHDCVVLSAFGCGAYKNPPAHIAIIEIAFAILDDHNAGQKHNPHGNYMPFAQQFL